ncbi:hypothetical protein BH10PAT1_BH10PAT1_3540 [soil metagenome]
MDNQPLAPTIPKQDIFNANVTPQPVVTPPPAKPDNPHANAGKNFSMKLIFIILGGIIVLLLIILGARALVTKGNQSGEVTLTWWGLEEDEEAVAPLIAEYKQKNPNVTINFVKQSQENYRERLTNALANGKGPDIFEFHNSWVPMFANNLSPSTSDYSKIFYPVVTNDLKTKNGFVGIPLEMDDIALYINQDIFHAYGKNAPTTWDDFRKLAQQLTIFDSKGKIQQAGAAMGITNNMDYWQDVLALLMLQNGADLTNPNTLVGQSALTFFTNFSKTDRVWDYTLPTSTTDFTNGQLAMYFGTYKDAYKIKQKNPNLHFAIVPVPQLPSTGIANPSVAYASYWVNGVSNKSLNSTAAWNFLEFMSSSESLQELYKNEVKIRGYGNLYPRMDMQNLLLSDLSAGAFVYQASFAQSWYLHANTFDGDTGINTQIAKPYGDAVDAANSGTSDSAFAAEQSILNQILASYGLVNALPVATP